MKSNTFTEILSGKLQLGPYPMEKLKRVDKPTVLITDGIRRFDEREMGIARLRRGELGTPANTRPPVSGSSPSIASTLMSALNPGEMRETTTVAGDRVEIPENAAVMSRHIKSMGYFAGADVVGICELPQWAVYSHDSQGNEIELNHKYAICIAVDQGRSTMDASDGNDWISGAQSGRGYAMCGYIGDILASYIRRMGYPASLHSIRGYQVVVPPLLMLAGIGEMSRANIVLNPFLGLRYKASVVTTDLPLQPDKPVDFGLQDFCNKCMKCADECPSRSISSGDKILKNGYENWEFNADTCTRYRFQNPKGVSCGRCIKVCPWNKPEGWTHDLVRWMVEHTPAMNGFFVKMDDVFGYGKADARKKWWFDP